MPWMLSPKREGRKTFKILYLIFHASSAATSVLHLKRRDRRKALETQMFCFPWEVEKKGSKRWHSSCCPLRTSSHTHQKRHSSLRGRLNGPSMNSPESLVLSVKWLFRILAFWVKGSGWVNWWHVIDANGVALTRTSWVSECQSQFSEPDSLY